MDKLTYACASRVELPDGVYELVPQAGGHTTDGEVNQVDVQQYPDPSSEVQQYPDPSSEELGSVFACAGKPRSITLLFIKYNTSCFVCAFKFRS
jgi:hypothetical protein